jgi:hypothetical protein
MAGKYVIENVVWFAWWPVGTTVGISLEELIAAHPLLACGTK